MCGSLVYVSMMEVGSAKLRYLMRQGRLCAIGLISALALAGCGSTDPTSLMTGLWSGVLRPSSISFELTETADGQVSGTAVVFTLNSPITIELVVSGMHEHPNVTLAIVEDSTEFSFAGQVEDRNTVRGAFLFLRPIQDTIPVLVLRRVE